MRERKKRREKVKERNGGNGGNVPLQNLQGREEGKIKRGREAGG